MPWFWSDQYDLTLQIAGLADEGAQTVRRDLGDGAFILFHLAADGRLVAASGIGPGNAVARDIRLAEMLIATARRADRRHSSPRRTSSSRRCSPPDVANRRKDIMSRNRPTIADLRAMKGKRQLTMLRVMTLEEAEAAEKRRRRHRLDPAGTAARPALSRRRAEPVLHAGREFFEIGTADDFVRWAFRMYKAGADAVYCSASYATIKRMADEAIPVIGHVGLIPSRAHLDRRLQGRRQDGGERAARS